MSKITKATFKSFIKKNRENLVIKTDSHFDGMYDCVMPSDDKGFYPVQSAAFHQNNLGIAGVWLVGSSRDSFTDYFDSDGYVGINVYNCCGSFTVAVKNPHEASLKALSKKA